MKLSPRRLTAVCALTIGLIGSGAASAAMVLNETFDPATFDTAFATGQLDPASRTGTQPPWYRYSLNDSTHYVSDPAGELVVGVAGSNDGGTNATFNPVTLAEAGQFVEVTFDAYRSSGSGNFGNDFRFALIETGGSITSNGPFPSDVDGIRVDMGIGTSTASRYAIIDNGDQLDGNPNANGAGFTGGWGSALTDDVQTFQMTVTRNAGDGLDLQLAVDGSVIADSVLTVSAGDVSTYTFDNFSAFVKQDIGFNLDNVSVNFVPEPTSAAGMIGLGLLGLVRRRR